MSLDFLSSLMPQPEASAQSFMPAADADIPAQLSTTTAADVAAIVQVAEGVMQARAKGGDDGQPDMFALGTGEKLGSTGLLLAVRREIRLAREQGRVADLAEWESRLPLAEARVDDFMKKSGLTRKQLFPWDSLVARGTPLSSLDAVPAPSTPAPERSRP